MVIDDELQGEVGSGSDRNRLFKKAVSKGMISLKMDGIQKVKQGLTTYEEVLRVSR